MTARGIAGDLPDIDSLKNLCRSMAMAEAILNPDGECVHSYSAHWAETGQVASMRNGSGDELDIVFAPVGAYIRGFGHESPLSPYRHEDGPEPWPGVLDSVPEAFRCYVEEPAFTDEDGCPVVTACLWRETGAPSWQTGPITFPADRLDLDGSARLFELLLAPTSEAFQAFAEDCYKVSVDIEALRHVCELRPLGLPQIIALNPSVPVESVVVAAGTIGYSLTLDDCPSQPMSSRGHHVHEAEGVGSKKPFRRLLPQAWTTVLSALHHDARSRSRSSGHGKGRTWSVSGSSTSPRQAASACHRTDATWKRSAVRDTASRPPSPT
ncbi:hypothetical protein ACN6K9_004998 [Streptomyces sp. SAS_267]|uniref:hypothetical protein n=1 Tax=Streptomyces sp. SAS_267 TaxID=3412750 RepID=UPI00403D013C